MPLRKFRKTRKLKPIDAIRVMTGSKKWYQSTTIRSAIVSAVTFIFVFLKLNTEGAEVEGMVAAALNIVATFYTIKGRKDAREVIE